MFGHDWVDSTATIVASHITGTSGDGMVSTREFAADVVAPDGSVFRAVIQEPTIATDFWPPSPGTVVKVHVDMKRQKVKFDKSDPQISYKQQNKKIDDRFERIASATPAAPAATPDFTPDPARLHTFKEIVNAGPADRLKQLEELKAQGLITADEYDAKRQAIVDAL